MLVMQLVKKQKLAENTLIIIGDTHTHAHTHTHTDDLTGQDRIENKVMSVTFM